MVGSKIWKVVQCEREWGMGDAGGMAGGGGVGDSFRGCCYVSGVG